MCACSALQHFRGLARGWLKGASAAGSASPQVLPSPDLWTNFAIPQVLGSAYPWIARRLLTDRSPELREALRSLLYGQDGRFRFSRLESLLQVRLLCTSCTRTSYAVGAVRSGPDEQAHKRATPRKSSPGA